MEGKKEKLLRRIKIGVIILLLPIICGNIDYRWISNHQRPLCTPFWTGYFDGGTNMGIGFGYIVYSHHGALYSVHHGKDWLHADWAEGPELAFWFWPYTYLNRENVTVTKIKRSSE